ncbi:RNA polymerase factor sigma-54 [Maritalea myrionectae]|uniref:RNA polymerase factor sigma-54 n=1 Tax=Maritalea myrionectae TaxID=454601 RepID=UPI00047FEFA6|nr:RNA polymerase factor sigma-54 [Maritalea myrionectae]
MAIGPRLDIRQSQTLALTPQLMQSIKLLQLSHTELSQFVEEELMRNPLLDRDDGGEERTVEEEPAAKADDRAVDVSSRGEQLGSAVSVAQEMDTDVANLYPEQVGQDSLSQSLSWPEGKHTSGGQETGDFEQFAAGEKSLNDHLIEQISLILSHPGDMLIASALIENLNETGYVDVPLDQIADQLGTELGHVEAVLEAVQGCDPLGIFARDLTECLAIQLREKDRLDPMMQMLLDNLDLLAAHKITELQKLLGADAEDLGDMLAEIRRLDPRPGRAFEGSNVQAIVPDVFVRQGNSKEWVIELNQEVLPKVLINRTYLASVSASAKKGEDKTYLSECLQTANWLTKSLDQRAQTILKVTKEIVRQQDGFLHHGVSQLRPMTLKMVAEEIEMHESTISRVTSNKYVSTPRGLFELKYFFTSAIHSASGEADHSAESVKYRIKQLIDAEDPRKILSDDKIAAILNDEQSMNVARRTVAKYREAMNIASSVIRRRQKRELVR